MGLKFLKNDTWKPWAFYSVLALVILAPLLKSGFVLTLDMIFTPNIGVPTGSNNTIFYALLHLLNSFLPADIVQKLMMFSVLLVSGVGMHRFIEKKPAPPKLRTNNKLSLDIVRIYGKTSVFTTLKANPAVPAYFAGILYVVNPYTYERWMAGHYLLLAGYAVLPWLLRSLFGFVNRPDWKGSLRLALYYTVIALLSIHILVIAAIIGVVAVVVHTLSAPSKLKYIEESLWSNVFLVLWFAVINSFWLSPVLQGTSPINKTLNAFTSQHLEAFTTSAHPQAGLLVNVATMHGFWLERFNRFVIPNKTIALVIPIMLILLVLAGIGFKRRLKHDKPQAITILLLGVLGFALAAGIHAPWGGVTEWLLLHVPLLKGFREPEKFSVLLVLMYAYFGAYGLQVFAEKVASKKDSLFNYLPTALLVVPLALVPVMPFGFAGQLKAVHYPASWYTFAQRLGQDSGDYKVLFLPWHQYMSYEFNERIIANPAPSFFGDKIISGDNAEFGDVYRDTANPTSDFIEQQILAKAGQANIGTRLASKKIKYVVLAHGPDWQDYIFLANQPQLELISEDNSLIVYRNKAFK